MKKGRGLLVLDKSKSNKLAEVKCDKKSNLLVRILSALIIGPIFIIAIMFSKILFYSLMLLITVAMLYEWYQMTKSLVRYVLIGFIIIPISTITLIILATEDKNRWLLLLYFVIIWSVDTFAMIGGKKIGGAKLAPKLSPNKTWSGLIVGILVAGFSAFLLSLVPSFNLPNCYFLNKNFLIITSIYLALIAQMSDLFISYFKRKFTIKDSGTMIPGHGGFLDRFDSIILTTPILFFIIKIV
jgi:phosphatidate cytidylyltransferase